LASKHLNQIPLFIHGDSTSLILVLVYVDDIIITGSNSSLVTSLITSLGSQFSLKDLGPLHFFLGIQVDSQSNGIHLSQPQYLHNLLIRSKMNGAKPCKTPFAKGDPLSKFDGTLMVDPHLYRSIVGALQYATITRPDISYVVNKASQFMHSPTDEHWNGVKRILRAPYPMDFISALIPHLSFTHNLMLIGLDALMITARLRGFVSLLVPIYFLGGPRSNPLFLNLARRLNIEACTELIWLQQLLLELHVLLISNPVLWCDNLEVTFLASNSVFHARTKHIEIDYHFVREKVASKTLDVRFISSKDQQADLFTKSLTAARLEFLRNKLTLCSHSRSA
jgi:Reverse transcriptase (RNA-dependent DNA polymerase)